MFSFHAENESAADNFKNLKSAFKDAAFATRKHGSVRCVSLYFLKDEDDVINDIRAFCAATTQQFGAISSKCVLTMDPYFDFATHMNKHLGHRNVPDFGQGSMPDLLILHYIGCAQLEGKSNLVLRDSASFGDKKLLLRCVTSWLENYQSVTPGMDILAILDCCYAGNLQYQGDEYGKKSFELIFAESNNNMYGRPNGTFTQKVIAAIDVYRHMKPNRQSVDPIELITHIQRKQTSRKQTSPLVPGHKIIAGGSQLNLHFRPLPGDFEEVSPATNEEHICCRVVYPRPPDVTPTAIVNLSIALHNNSDHLQIESIISEIKAISDHIKRLKVISVEGARSTSVLVQAPATWALRVAAIAPAGMVTVLGITDFDEDDPPAEVKKAKRSPPPLMRKPILNNGS